MRTEKDRIQWDLVLQTKVGMKLNTKELEAGIIEAETSETLEQFLEEHKNSEFTKEDLILFWKVVWSVHS